MNKVIFVISRKTVDSICAGNKTQTSDQKLEFQKAGELKNFLIFKAFSNETNVTLTNIIILI
jgi:hypothetical protein